MRKFWTADEDALMRRLYPDTPTAKLAEQLGRPLASTYQRAATLGLKKSEAYLASPAAGRTTGRHGMGTRFAKGQAPANKGLRRPGWGPGRMKSTQFKPGVRLGVAAKNWQPIGSIRSDPEGYQRIKVRDAVKGEHYGFGNVRVWPLLQRHVWEQAHGSIPAGHAVTFRDGNKANCDLGNLELVSRADLMKRNTIHNYPKPIAQAIQLLGALKRQIRKREPRAS